MNISEDLFADCYFLEDQDKKEKSNEKITDLIEGLTIGGTNAVNFHFNSNMSEASVRSELLRLSLINFQKNKELEAVFYQSEALGIGVEYSYDFEKTKEFNLKDIIDTMPCDISLDNLSKEEISAFLFPDVEITETKTIEDFETDVNISANLSKLQNEFNQLPDEWTTIQICKEYNPYGFSMIARDIFEYNSSIYISLLTYSRWELNDKNPICICLNPYSSNNYTGNIYKDLLNLKEEIEKIGEFVSNKCSIDNKKSYAIFLSSLEKLLEDHINHLKEWLGPWICLFLGKLKTAAALAEENKLFKLVDNYCQRKKYSSRQTVLVSLIARGLHLINDDKILTAATYIIEKKTEQLLLHKFLISLKSKVNTKQINYFPCILVIDELLDQFPWEMVMPSQEFSRMYSIYLLMKLNKQYKKQIKRGYLHKIVQHGNCLINPDNNLELMEKRMLLFFNYWLPNWKCIAGTKLTQEESLNFLKSCDLYVYTGHGSGLQFFKANNIIEQKLDCIVFLFGCNSTKMVSYGHNTAMTAPHIYYHIAQCPSILGMNFIITDYECDFVTTTIISYWIPSNKDIHFKHANKKLFRTGVLEFDKNPNERYYINEKNFNPNLCEIIGNIRLDANIPLKMKAAIVYRGLPVVNSYKLINNK